MHRFRRTLCALIIFACGAADAAEPQGGALAGERLRVLVSTDIGGSDPDDIQSMIHFLLYADLFEIEGLISSPPHAGRARDILAVIDAYEQDYRKLLARTRSFPAPATLRAITKQGAIDAAPEQGFNAPTEGSEWIIRCARRDDPRPLYILVWGSITDVAQALRDAPDIKEKIRVHFVASWNRVQDPHSFAYLEREHADLWMIQDETTFRGWYMGGDQSGDLGNRSFVEAHVKDRGALGRMFAPLRGGDIKMGDTPTVARLLRGTPEDPTQPSWGGRFIPHPDRPRWWIDVPDPAWTEANRPGAKTVNRWREGYLRDWQRRMAWLE